MACPLRARSAGQRRELTVTRGYPDIPAHLDRQADPLHRQALQAGGQGSWEAGRLTAVARSRCSELTAATAPAGCSTSPEVCDAWAAVVADRALSPPTDLGLGAVHQLVGLSHLSHRLRGLGQIRGLGLDDLRTLTCGYGSWRTGWTPRSDLRIRRLGVRVPPSAPRSRPCDSPSGGLHMCCTAVKYSSGAGRAGGA